MRIKILLPILLGGLLLACTRPEPFMTVASDEHRLLLLVADIENLALHNDEQGLPVLLLRLNERGQQKLSRFTEQRLGHKASFYFQDQALVEDAPIQDVFSSQELMIAIPDHALAEQMINTYSKQD